MIPHDAREQSLEAKPEKTNKRHLNWTVLIIVTAVWLASSAFIHRGFQSNQDWGAFQRHAMKTLWAFEALDIRNESIGDWASGAGTPIQMLEILHADYASLVHCANAEALKAELAVLNHRLALESNDPRTKKTLLKDGAALLEQQCPTSSEYFDRQARKVLLAQRLDQSDRAHLLEMLRKWPDYWPLHHLLRQTGEMPENVTAVFDGNAARAVDDLKSANLFCLAMLLGGLPGLALLAGWKPVSPPPDRQSVRRLRRLWHPHKLLTTFVASILISQTAGLIFGKSGEFRLDWLLGTSTGSWWTTQVLNQLFSALLVLLPVYWLLAGYVRKKRWFTETLGISMADFRSVKLWIRSTFLAFAILLISALLQYGLSASGWPSEPEDWVSRSSAEWGVVALPMSLFWGALVAPITEEILFRGLLFRSFSNFASPLIAGTLSSFLFAASHHYSTQGFVIVFAMGAAFAWIFHRSGRLTDSMMTHAMINVLIGFYEFIWLQQGFASPP